MGLRLIREQVIDLPVTSSQATPPGPVDRVIPNICGLNQQAQTINPGDAVPFELCVENTGTISGEIQISILEIDPASNQLIKEKKFLVVVGPSNVFVLSNTETSTDPFMVPDQYQGSRIKIIIALNQVEAGSLVYYVEGKGEDNARIPESNGLIKGALAGLTAVSLYKLLKNR